jgi:magnesium transporter
MSTESERSKSVAALIAPDILELLDAAPDAIAAETEEMHAADLADVATAIPRERVRDLLAALPAARAADVLEYLGDELRTEVLEEMSAEEAARLVAEMNPDERADALEELEEDTFDEILSEIPQETREETERLLAYEPDTAGGLMTTEFVSVPGDRTVEEALFAVRRFARSGRAEGLHAIYVIDPEGRVVGVLSLRELLAAPEGARVSDVAWEEVVTVSPDADREEVAQLTSKYDVVALPVADDQGRMVGIVTVDDVIDAMEQEHTEDVQKFGGMEAIEHPYMETGVLLMLRKRAGWLAALFIGEMLTASAMQHFEAELAQAVVLALFIPLIISSGGNSGSQATSLIIRAMALQEVRLRDWWRVAGREAISGISLGLILGSIGFLRIVLWQMLGIWDYGPFWLLIALAVGLSLLTIVFFGTMVGSMLPFILRRLGFDPASASAPFVATLVDVTGISIYFTIALLVLRGTLL